MRRPPSNHTKGKFRSATSATGSCQTTAGQSMSTDTILKALEHKFCHGPLNSGGHFQGTVEVAASDGLLLRLYSWLDGRPTSLRVIDRSAVSLLDFYDDEDEWREAGDRLAKKVSGDEIRRQPESG
jgi:hypothetical protein